MKGLDTFRLERLFPSKATSRVLEYMLSIPGETCIYGDVSKGTDLSWVAGKKAIDSLAELGVIDKDIMHKHVTVFKLADSDMIRLLTKFVKDVIPFLRSIEA